MTPRWIALVWVVVAGCSTIVDPDDGSLPCVLREDGWDPCPEGLYCVANECVQQRCVPTEELCNAEDDDCDGMLDEGHDVDGDTFTWCGGGDMRLADCDDSQAGAHPADPARGMAAAPETCDGLDNDCNGAVDDGELCGAGKACIDRTCVNPDDCTLLGNECPSGQVCDTSAMPPTCIPGSDCRVVGATCPSGEICDSATGNCVRPGSLGMTCATDAECSEGYCALRGAVGLAGEGRICAKACCSDAECPPGTLCYAPGNGARMCIPAEVVGLQPGSGGALASCSAGDECASGFCENNQCLWNCGGHADCAGGSCTASLRQTDSRFATYCRGGSSGRGTGDFCTAGDQCRFGACYAVFGGGVCSGPCGTTSDCPGSSWYCGWDDFDGSRLQLCLVRGWDYGSDPAGASCGSNTECRDVACVSGRCWSACCNDDDCPGTQTCKAVTFGSGRFQMHCDPR